MSENLGATVGRPCGYIPGLIIILFLNPACLYIACRQEGVPRTFKEIVAVSTVSKKEIGRCFKVKFLSFF